MTWPAFAVLSGFAAALTAPWLTRAAGRAAPLLLAVIPATMAVAFAAATPSVAGGRAIAGRFDWIPALGLTLSWRLDGLSLLFALLITGVGALVLVYSAGYMADKPLPGRFAAFLLTFLASMLGLVLADNALALYVFWELTTVSSFLLIGFEHEDAGARRAATQALLITAAGGLAMLAGLVLLGQAAGTYELSAMAGRSAEITAHPLYPAILVLILAGAFTKSAQVPFQSWLPAAMAAPTPVSAYLHSATMVKAGVYLLARLTPVLGGTDPWFLALAGFGAATMLFGGAMTVIQADLKRILAYATVAALGLMVMLIGLGTPDAVKAAMTFLLAHAFYKGALFLVAGIIDHGTGTRDVAQLGGLWRVMPLTFAAAVAAGLSMAALPPSFGFLAKEAAFESALHPAGAALWTGAAVFAGATFFAAAGLAGLGPFLGGRRDTPHEPHTAPASMWLPAGLLAAGGLLTGVWPDPVEPLLSAAAGAVSGKPAEVSLALWHGITPGLALSAVSIAAGLWLFLRAPRLRSLRAEWSDAHPLIAGGWYDPALSGLLAGAGALTGVLQSGYLRYYVLIAVSTAAGLAAWPLIAGGGWAAPTGWDEIRFYDVGLAVLIVAAAAAAVTTRARMPAIIALGAVGFGVSLVFLVFGAPDVAMTQFLVETLTVILFVLVFHRVAESPPLSPPATRLRDAAVAAAVGALMTGLTLISAAATRHPTVASYHLDRGVPDAHGRNIVNVILTDFRALDTLGEITVVAAAAAGVYALLAVPPPAGGAAPAPTPPPPTEDRR